MRKVWLKLLLTAVLATSLLAGCSLGGGNVDKQEESAALRVMYYDEGAFFDQFGMLFYALHPEVEIEVVSTQRIVWEEDKDMNAAMLEFIEEEQPDIVMVQPNQLTELAEEGKLLDLDTLVEEKTFDKESLMPGLLDYLRDLGGGKLYGLSPSFNGQAVFYNKDLFEKYGVDLPTDKMSWDELLRLAAMFPTDGSDEDRVYGLKAGYRSNLFDLGLLIGQAHNLNFVDTSGQQVTINSEAWKRVFETAHAAIKSGSLYAEDPFQGGANFDYQDYLLQDPFVSGKVAMSMDSHFLMTQIKQAQDQVPDKAVRNWDLVTMPVDPANPEVSPYMSIYQIFAINSKSTQNKAAWRFLSYIHSDEFARVTAKRQYSNMSVRTKYINDDEGRNMAAFYSLKPAHTSISNNYIKLPNEFLMQFTGMAQGQLSALNEDSQKSIAEVLDELQQQGQEALMLARQNQESGAESSASTSSSPSLTTE